MTNSSRAFSDNLPNLICDSPGPGRFPCRRYWTACTVLPGRLLGPESRVTDPRVATHRPATDCPELLQASRLAFVRARPYHERAASDRRGLSPRSVSTAAWRTYPVLWGWRDPPEGHRVGSRPRHARERKQLSRSSEPCGPPLPGKAAPRATGPAPAKRLRSLWESGHLALFAGMVPLSLSSGPSPAKPVEERRACTRKYKIQTGARCRDSFFGVQLSSVLPSAASWRPGTSQLIDGTQDTSDDSKLRARP
jgi:hypothetical protein